MFKRIKFNLLNGKKGFSIWHYKATSREEASAARFHLGFFPTDLMNKGDVLYITDQDSMTTHHWIDINKNEQKVMVWNFS